MGNFSLGNRTTAVLKTVDQNVLYINTSKASACKTAIKKDLDNISNDLTNIYKCLKKCCDKKVVQGAWAKQMLGWANKAKSQAAATKDRAKGLTSKFDADTKEYTIKLLTDRIAALEKQIRELMNR